MESDQWLSNPAAFYANILAIKRQKKKLVRLSSKQEINELLDQANGLLEILKDSGNPVPSSLSPSSSNSGTRKVKKVSLSNSSNDELLAVLARPVASKALVKVVPAAKAPVKVVPAAKALVKVVPAAKAHVKVVPATVVPAAKASAKPPARSRTLKKGNSPTTAAAYDLVIPFEPPKVSPASCSKLNQAFVDNWMAGIAGSLAVEIARHRRDPPRGIRNESVHPAFNRDFVVKQTEGDGTCLIHAFLTDMSPVYRGLPRTVQGIVGRAFRKQVYAFLFPADAEMKLEQEDYDHFAEPEPSTHAREVVMDDGNVELRANARAYIRDTNGYLYDTDVAHLQECFGVRILLITKSDVAHDRIRLIGEVNPDDLAREYATEQAANIPADKYTKYMLIFVRPGHYEGIKHRTRDQYLFGYPDVRDVIQAAVGQGVVIDTGLKERLVPGTVVTLADGRVVAVHESGVRGWFPPFEDAAYVPVGVYVDVGEAEPYLADLTEIVAIGEEPFDSVPYLVERFQPNVSVRLTNGAYRLVHRKGLQMVAGRPIGLWLKEGTGSQLYSLDTIAFVGSEPAKGHARAVQGERFRIGQFKVVNANSVSSINSNANSSSDSSSGFFSGFTTSSSGSPSSSSSPSPSSSSSSSSPPLRTKGRITRKLIRRP